MEKNEDLRNATQSIETEIETEDPSRRRQAFQDYRHRQAASHALRQAPSAGNESAWSYAQAQEDDQGQPGRRSQDHADASLRLEVVEKYFEFRWTSRGFLRKRIVRALEMKCGTWEKTSCTLLSVFCEWRFVT